MLVTVVVVCTASVVMMLVYNNKTAYLVSTTPTDYELSS